MSDPSGKYKPFALELQQSMKVYAELTDFKPPTTASVENGAAASTKATTPTAQRAAASTPGWTRITDLATTFTCTVNQQEVQIRFGKFGGVGMLKLGDTVWVDDQAAGGDDQAAGGVQAGPACAGDHGTSKACCGQGHSPVAPQYQCPANLPKCVDYVYDKHMGHCVNAPTPPTPAPPPTFPPTPAPTVAKVYTPAFGRFVYQSLSADDFTLFDNTFGHKVSRLLITSLDQ
jgi:hypothetical protein